MMNNNTLKAVLAIAALNEEDREWIMSKLDKDAIQKVQTAWAGLKNENMPMMAEQLAQTEKQALVIEKQLLAQEQQLLANPQQLMALFKQEPQWFRDYCVACLSPIGRTLLLKDEASEQKQYPAMPKGLHQAMILSMGEVGQNQQQTER